LEKLRSGENTSSLLNAIRWACADTVAKQKAELSAKAKE
jgi:hypothetical protein